MYLALDYGDRYIGVAATDHEGKIPYRYGMIDQKQESALPRIQEIIQREQTQQVLVGVPISLEGNETEQTHKTLKFIERLREVVDPEVEIEGVDETLTSVEAQSMLRHEGGKAEDEHAEAARLILADYLRTLA
ncbi:MAG: Holliday junction resolvase RuvX [Candidatus Andersenbacteria bacterium]